MKKILAGLPVFFSGVNMAFAQCSINGEEIPCDQMPAWFWPTIIAIPVLVLVGFIFWLWMLIDAIKKPIENKMLWILVVFFGNILGALIYFFVVKRAHGGNIPGKV
jgi:sterol desaturase/sphingolipid hydroxylase (fatty acid hydroxylase superfamily)